MLLTMRASLANDLADLANRLDRSDLIVGEHHRDEYRVGPQRFAHVFNSHNPVLVNGQTRNFPTALLQRVANAAYRWMLDRGRDDVFSMRGRRFADPANREVVCFGST